MKQLAVLLMLVAVAACGDNPTGPYEPVLEPEPEPPEVEPPDLGPVHSIQFGPVDTLHVATDTIDLRDHVRFARDAEGDSIPAAMAIAELDATSIGWEPSDGLDPSAGHSGAIGSGWLVPMPSELPTYRLDGQGHWRVCVEVYLDGAHSGGIYVSVWQDQEENT